MTATSWIKFYPSDWLGDVKLRQCSIAARGLWIDLICIMTDAKPYGHLAINDKPMSYYRIAQLVRAERKQVQRLMAHLKTRGVLRVNSRGISYSDRMVRDHAKSQLGQAFAQRRWGVIPNAPDTRKKERGITKEEKPTKQTNGYAKAQHGVLQVLSLKLGIGYAQAMDMLAAHPDVCERATRAEIRKQGEGVQVAVVALQKIMRGKTP